MSKLKPRLEVLILQHPQEPDKELGSAKLAAELLENVTLKVGLSWPNLKKALGRENVDANRWGILYLGAKKGIQPRLSLTTRQKEEISPEEAALQGIVVLDGTWSQAKTLWWRNAWVLKLNRIALNPVHRSLYGKLRREPRRECLSTIEAIAETFDCLSENPEIGKMLRTSFQSHLEKVAPQ